MQGLTVTMSGGTRRVAVISRASSNSASLSSPTLSPGASFLGHFRSGEDLASFSGQVLSRGKTTPNRAFSKDPALSQVTNLRFT